MFGGFAQVGLVADAQAIIADSPRGQAPKLPVFATAQQVVPPDFDPDQAGAFITFKETLSFLQRLGVQAGKSVLILGSGTVGLSFALGAKLMGAGPVMITGRRAEPLRTALTWGADCAVNVVEEDLTAAVRRETAGKGADFVVEAVGDWDALQGGIRALADGGQIGIYGVAPDRAATLDWSGTPSNWALRFVQPKEEDVHQQVLDQMRHGWVDLTRFVSHRLPFDAIGEGFDLVKSKQAIKVSIRIQ
jgi:L-iditol 2-dehydrogenase